MNVEFCAAAAYTTAVALIQKHTGPDIKAGIATLLESRDTYKREESTGGKNCSEAINRAIKTLQVRRGGVAAQFGRRGGGGVC